MNHLRDGKGRFATGNRRHGKPVLARYRVQHETGCWIWLGNINKGYGRCKQGDKTAMAHRVFYEHHVGPIPQGTELDHLCRQRSCVNPAHLEPVTRAENVRRGASAKLTPQDVREIRRVMDELCERYGVTPSALHLVADRKTWKEIED